MKNKEQFYAYMLVSALVLYLLCAFISADFRPAMMDFTVRANFSAIWLSGVGLYLLIFFERKE